MMNQIKLFNLYKLHNAEHFQFMTEVDGLILKYLASELMIDEFYPSFKTCLTTEDIALGVESGSARSKLLKELDEQRDQTWNAIDKRIESALLSPFEDEVDSAKVLKRILDKYGDIREEPYNAESGDMTMLVTDLLKPENALHLEKVCIKTWVPELKKENDQFQIVFNDRNKEYSGRASGDVRAARNVLDPVYYDIINRINATFVVKMAKPAAASFTSELNEIIKYYKTTLITRKGRRKGKNSPDKPNGE